MKLKNVEDVYPLSPLQQGILFHSLYAPDSEAYVEQVGWTCAEAFNEAAFSEAWRQVMARHPALRACFFREQLKQPLQVVRQQVELPCERHDWSDVPGAECKEKLAAFLATDRRRGFDLTKAPLMRLSRIRLAAGHQFVWTYHHLLLDGWSIALVLREIFQLYQALCDGVRLELEARRPFRDYIAWLQQQDEKLAEGYWRERLRGFVAPTPLGAERIHGAAVASEPESYRTQQTQLTPAGTEKLRAFARQYQLTLGTLVEGAWALLLTRYSGEREAVFGTVVNGRPSTLPGAEAMVGLFINTLPLRVAVPAEAQCVPWLKELQRQRIKMRQYEHSALAQIHEWSDVPGGQPLFRSIVAFDNATDDAALNEGIEGGEISNVFRANTNTSYPLTVEVVAGRTLSLHLTYDERHFDADTVARMTAHLENLLLGFTQDAAQRISGLPMLQQCEQQQLLTDWCATTVDYPEEANIPGLFEAQVERSPAAVAVTFAEAHLTYAELNCRSNRLAHYLRSLGVGAETLVGIYAERSLEMVCGLLGILKAGATYVPLDPAHPQQSLAFMLADANVPVLLTQRHLAHSLPEHGAHVVLLDGGDAEWMTLSEKNPQLVLQPDSVAYAIYTSGSTGQPKAALNTHRAIANRLLWMQDAYGLTADDAVLQKTPFTFDVSVWEFFWPLITGARLVLAEPGGHQDSAYLSTLIANQGITTVHFVPSMLAVFLEAEGLEQCRSLKRVICSGEALSFDLQQRFFSRLNAQLHNLYGPTEAAVDVTFWQCLRGDPEGAVPIGKPIANIRIYLLDRELQPVPIGVPGELHIGGVGLARGYLRRPALTAEKFIPDPFSNAAGDRLYKTGDLARYREDGAIEFLGRLDHQVKIRGFRIELGEIEARLSQHPSVQEAVVVAHTEQTGENRLVAYVTSAPGQRPKPSELRHFLSEQSPQYMVPSVFVVLEQLPLTHNGKLDRRALPVPGGARPALDEAPVAPRTAAEQTLAAVWAEVLGLDQVGIHDNFFELGGDSIISMQLVARAKQEGLNFAPRDLFAHQTIAELAAITASVAAPQAEQGTITGPSPLAPIQHWFFEQKFLDPHHFNQAVWLEARQALNPRLLEQAIEKLLAHHDALRLRFTPDTSGWRQTNAEREEAAIFLHADLSELPEAERERATSEVATALQASLNLSSGPLVRAALFGYGAAQPARLLLVIHHLAVDGVSWRILLADLQSAYEQLRRGAAVKLPSKTTSFKQWAERLTEYAKSEAIMAEADYWLAETGKTTTPLPLDFARGENTVASARTVTVSLSVEETSALLHEVPRAYHTQINDALLTGVAQVFARWTGQKHVLLNLEGHGRENPFADLDLTRTVGWFTSLFPVRLKLDEAALPGAILCAIKEQLRAVPNRGIGYGLLRYLGRVSGAPLRDAPQPAVCFNYLGQFDQFLPESALLRDAGEAPGATRSSRASRSHLLEIDGGITGGQLHLRWTYSENLHRRSTIEGLACDFVEALRGLIAHCQSPGAGGFTPSDFPLARLTQAQLDELSRDGRRIEDVYPLSPMQEGLLFHALRSPKSEVYCEQMSFGIRGELDIAAFERAWRETVEQHAILRTAFVWQDLDEPMQVINQHAPLLLNNLDWRGLASEEQAELLAAFRQEDRSLGFDFSNPPLMRLSLIRLEEQVFELVWTHHHILLDGWSVPLLFRKVLELYEAFTEGRQPRHTMHRPYREYIAWLRRQDLRKAEAFWRETLGGFNAPTPLPGSALPRDGKESYGQQQILLSRKLTGALRALSREHRLTLNTLSQGAWALLLSRYSGERDVVFGTTVAGRPAELAESEQMIGLFINTLPVRVRVSDRERVLPWLKRLQAGQAEASQYLYSPLARVQGWSDVPPGVPLFESLVVFENYPDDVSLEQSLGNIEISSARTVESTNFPMTLVVVPGEEMAVRILYDRRRFAPPTMMRLLAHFERLLESLTMDTAQSLAQLPLLSEAERKAVLVEWNDTQAEYPANECFHHLVEQQVKKTPDALAVSCMGQRLSYQELNARANQLAHYLRSLGVGPEIRVGVCVGRSIEMVIARLAVLKAGGAYVSLDPDYPPARLAFMLEDACVPVLLTQQELVGRWPGLQAKVVCLDKDWEVIARESIENPDAPVTPNNLAYVYYTSGSTGKPKGVETEHAGLVNLVTWHNRAYQVTPVDRKSQIAGLGFDASVWELWPYLVAGASVHIPSEETRASWPQLLSWMVAEAITICFLPTPLAEAVVNDDWPEGLALRALLTGGDKLHRWPQRALPFSFVNKYGPTEVSAVTTWAPMTAATDADATPPIGRPIANTQTFVLNDQLQPVPIGAPGELYIGGIGLARGYLNRPELTAEKFIPHPFSDKPGARLYKSGDLVRYFPDGNIEFLGRIDQQVKIRGYRIELGEIEAALAEHVAVREVTVLARQDMPGGKQLVAYYVAQGDVPEAEALQNFLREKVPEYMIPVAFVSLESLPLTPNGKIDRRALPVPQSSQSVSAYVAPRNPDEEVLAEIWAQVLGLDRVGVNDNFFELGGDSILSIRIIARAGQRGIGLSPNDLFLHPTISELAEACAMMADQSHTENTAATSPPLAAARPTPQTGGVTPKDFPDADLSQRELDQLLARLASAQQAGNS